MSNGIVGSMVNYMEDYKSMVPCAKIVPNLLGIRGIWNLLGIRTGLALSNLGLIDVSNFVDMFF